MKVAILGSTSYIAKSLIPEFLFRDIELRLFCRCMDNFGSFGNEEYDIIINCIGAGSPNRIKMIGELLIRDDEKFDRMALEYLENYPQCKYVYLSSGIVNTNKESTYKLVKINAEKRHRLSNKNIVDIRIYSFFSRFIKYGYGFFMSELMRCLHTGDTFVWRPIIRDYISPDDLCELILCTEGNRVIDAASRKPVSSFEIVNYFKKIYCLNVKFEDAEKDIYIPTPSYSSRLTSMHTIEMESL